MELKSRFDENGKLVFETCKLKDGRKSHKFEKLEPLKEFLQERIKRHKEALAELLNAYADLERAFEPGTFTDLLAQYGRAQGENRADADVIGTVEFEANAIGEVRIKRAKAELVQGGAGSATGWRSFEEVVEFLRETKRLELLKRFTTLTEPSTSVAALQQVFSHYEDRGTVIVEKTKKQPKMPTQKKRTNPHSKAKPSVRRQQVETPDDQEMSIQAHTVSENGTVPESRIYGAIETAKEVAKGMATAALATGVVGAVGAMTGEAQVSRIEAVS